LLQIAVPTRTDVPECMLLFYLWCHLHYIFLQNRWWFYFWFLNHDWLYSFLVYRSKAYKSGSWNCWSNQWKIWIIEYCSYTSPGTLLIRW
jgi:hypothetical protein